MSEVLYAPLLRFADVVMGQSPGADLCNTEGKGLPFLQGCAEFGAHYPQAAVYCAPPLRIAKSSSILISVRAPVGTLNYADQDYCIGRGLGAFKAKVGIANNVFLKYAVELNTTYLHRLSQGSTFAAVSTDDIKSFPIPVFDIKKQDKIASILACVDESISKVGTLIEKYQQIKAGLMHDMFTRGVLPNGKLRPQHKQAPELYQGTSIGKIPINWKTSNLRACLRSNPTNGIYKASDQIGEEGILMVGQSAFTAERSVDFSLCRRGTVSALELKRYGISKNDILVTRVFATVQGVGLPTLVPDLTEPAVFESNMMRLQVDASVILPRLLFEWLQSPIIRDHISAGTNASNQCSVNQNVLNSLPVPCIDMDEQKRIASKIEYLNHNYYANCAILDNLRQQKLGLMQDLLTGKVAVKTDEPETTHA